jgi:hypothetical protein
MTAILDESVMTSDGGSWLGEPATDLAGTLRDVARWLPAFHRVPFGVNRRLDMILRDPWEDCDRPMPAAVVSKRYVLVDHRAVVDALAGVLTRFDIDPDELTCTMTLSDAGTRMKLRVELPASLAFMPPDGHRLALTFECFNSVDRTVPFLALLGWFRLVCRNGLIVGTTHAKVRAQHRPSLRLEELGAVLEQGLEAAHRDAAALADLADHRIRTDRLQAWVDGPVARAWGPFAAARVYSVLERGVDGEPDPRPRFARPHERQLLRTSPVPGAAAPCRDLYGVTQALSWISSRRASVGAREAWRGQIGGLVAALAGG